MKRKRERKRASNFSVKSSSPSRASKKSGPLPLFFFLSSLLWKKSFGLPLVSSRALCTNFKLTPHRSSTIVNFGKNSNRILFFHVLSIQFLQFLFLFCNTKYSSFLLPRSSSLSTPLLDLHLPSVESRQVRLCCMRSLPLD